MNSPMTGHVLALNAGSSSLKFAVYDGSSLLNVLAAGSVSRIGTGPVLALKVTGEPAEFREAHEGPIDLRAAAGLVFDALDRRGLLGRIAAAGHRIVHGGALFVEPVRLTAEALDQLERLVPLAPLHQPHNLEIVRLAGARLPRAVQIGCFDTAFHARRPRLDTLYALPRDLIEEGIIAYGFHGLSYAHIAARLRDRDGASAGGRAIVAHLGSGASLCAMDRGKSVATTMGFSALDGLMMASRCGSIDPGVLLHLIEAKRMDGGALSDLLYSRSGLLGVSGISGDMQVLLASEAPEAAEAIDLYIYRAVRAIGSLIAALGGLDSLVFTAGIGENSPVIRQRIGDALAWIGVEIDGEANHAGHGEISALASRVRVQVIPTDEERAIAEGVLACLSR